MLHYHRCMWNPSDLGWYQAVSGSFYSLKYYNAKNHSLSWPCSSYFARYMNVTQCSRNHRDMICSAAECPYIYCKNMFSLIFLTFLQNFWFVRAPRGGFAVDSEGERTSDAAYGIVSCFRYSSAVFITSIRLIHKCRWVDGRGIVPSMTGLGFQIMYMPRLVCVVTPRTYGPAHSQRSSRLTQSFGCRAGKELLNQEIRQIHVLACCAWLTNRDVVIVTRKHTLELTNIRVRRSQNNREFTAT